MNIKHQTSNTIRVTYLTSIYVLLYLPIVILMLYSVNQARFSLRWHGFSMQWYEQLLQDHELWSTFFHSVLLGLSASLMATGMGLLACVHLFLHRRNHQHRLFDGLILVLIILPDIVLGIALLVFFNLTHMPLGFISLLIAHITFCLPFVVLTLSSRLEGVDRNIYFSALDLGASRWIALKKVLMPLLYPAVLSALLLSFTLSFDDVVISYFISGPEFNILPLTIYSLVRAGVTPELNALCTVTFLISMLLVMLAHYSARKTT